LIETKIDYVEVTRALGGTPFPVRVFMSGDAYAHTCDNDGALVPECLANFLLAISKAIEVAPMGTFGAVMETPFTVQSKNQTRFLIRFNPDVKDMESVTVCLLDEIADNNPEGIQ